MTHQFEVDSIELKYGSRTILSGVYMKLETGRITGLLGRNGSGKTSLFQIMYGNLRGTYQSLRFDRTPVSQPYRMKNLLTILPQHQFIPKDLSLKRIFHDFNADYNRFESQFEGFTDKYLTKIETLSGGQIRLIELFLILTSPSKFVILDEPFSHLTPVLTEQIQAFILEAAKTKGILVTDHLYEKVTQLADDLYLLSNGHMHTIKDLKELSFYGYVKQSILSS